MMVSRDIFRVELHSVEICKIFPPTIFCKNSVKSTFSLKSYTVNQFDEKILLWGKISEITTLCYSTFPVIHIVSSVPQVFLIYNRKY